MAINPIVKIDIQGEKIKEFLQFNINQEMLSPHSFTLFLRRSTFEKENTKIFSGSSKIIGKNITCTIESGNNKTEFKGIITGLETDVSDQGSGDTLTISANSPDIKLNDNGNCSSYKDKTLSSIINDALNAYNIDSDIKPNTTDKLSYIVQYNENAYNFIARLAVRFGEWFYYDGKKLIFGTLPQKTVNLLCNKDLLSFNISLKTINTNFSYQTHSYLKNEAIVGDSSGESISPPEDLTNINKSSEDIYKHKSSQYIGNYLDEADEQKNIKSFVKLTKGSDIYNMLVCQGTTDNPNLSLGCTINIENKETNVKYGRFIVYKLSHHSSRNGHYENSFTAIASNIKFSPYTNPLSYPLSNIQSAVVTDNNDPKKIGRIKVRFDWQKKDGETPWLRIVTPHAGEAKGFYFIPEIGEEVLVGFEENNAERPFIIGSLYHNKAKPEGKWINDKNDFKAIRRRGGFTLEINDKDGGEEVKIYDNKNNKYSILLSSHGKDIKIESEGTIEITAKDDMKITAKNIKITADQKIEMKANEIDENADQKIKLKASDIEENAQNSLKTSGTQVELKASATMKVDGGGQLEAKGGMVKIN
jgi:type VI secretion system secreted protein VgrG